MNITEGYIKSICYPEYYDRGVEYFRKGHILSIAEHDYHFVAKVKGKEVYTVTIGRNDLSVECECPAYTRHSACKHIIAVLFALSQGVSSIKPDQLSPRSSKPKATVPPLPPTPVSEFENPFKSLRNLIQRQQGAFGRWRSYFDLQDEIYSEGLEIIHTIPSTLDSAKKALELVVWYDKFLEKTDDSNGTNQNLQYAILMKAIDICVASQDHDTIWHLFSKYFTHEGSFSVNYTIVSGILSQPSWLAEKVGEDIHGKWSIFQYPWLHYLFNSEDTRFEPQARATLAKNHDNSVLILLIKYYHLHKRYQDVINTGWDYRNDYDINPLLHDALKKLRNTKKLIILLKKNLGKNFNVSHMEELEKIYIESYNSKSWQDLCNSIIAGYSAQDKVHCYMHLARYEEAVQILISTRNSFYPALDASTYALKLSCLHKGAAKKLYWFLVQEEVSKFKTSNYYPAFFSYIRQLLELGEQDNVYEFLKKLSKKYPTKKKLNAEILKIITLPQ